MTGGGASTARAMPRGARRSRLARSRPWSRTSSRPSFASTSRCRTCCTCSAGGTRSPRHWTAWRCSTTGTGSGCNAPRCPGPASARPRRCSPTAGCSSWAATTAGAWSKVCWPAASCTTRGPGNGKLVAPRRWRARGGATAPQPSAARSTSLAAARSCGTRSPPSPTWRRFVIARCTARRPTGGRPSRRCPRRAPGPVRWPWPTGTSR
mmetsp:Transcript_85346/g.260974  ORF Transcript_85346/g.260974 Transcript_85346/m.260974 type:complete len:208 (-) Transcript_85346:660-1283(-)